MKLAIASDLHSHPFREFAEVLPSGLNSRFADSIAVLDKIRAICIEQTITTFILAGDVFHKRRIMNVIVWNEIYDAFARFKEAGIRVILLRGNHDQADRAGMVHSLHGMRTICQIVDTPEVVDLGKTVHVNFIPYMDDSAAITKALKTKWDTRKPVSTYLCVGHFGVLGATTGSNEYTPLEPIDPKDLPTHYDFGFLGHYHRRQKLRDRWWYIGAPMQHNRGERGQEGKGFIIYDTAAPGKFTIKKLGMPEFVALTQDDIVAGGFKEKVRGNFVDVTLDEEPEGGADAFKSMLMKLGARGANVVCVEAKRSDEKRLDVHPGLSPMEMVTKYVEEYGDGEINAEALAFAKECLAKAETMEQ